MRGIRTGSAAAGGLAVAIAVLLAGYGYEYSLPMRPLVLIPAGTVITFTDSGDPVVRLWNVTGIGGHLVGAWSASNGSRMEVGPVGPPSPLLVPVSILCGGRFDLALPLGAYVLRFRAPAGTVVTVTDTLAVLPSDHVVREMAPGPANAVARCPTA